MNEEPTNKNARPALTDDEISALLISGKAKRVRKDPNAPSPRLPEALYFYTFIALEAALLMGVWGFMRLGEDAVMQGPGIDDPDVGRWLVFNFKSMIAGVGALLTSMPWVPAAVLAVAALVFLPTTPRQRKRAATLISTLIVAVFVLLIAMQFSEDMSKLTRSV